jgi:hypothetical protein
MQSMSEADTAERPSAMLSGCTPAYTAVAGETGRLALHINTHASWHYPANIM